MAKEKMYTADEVKAMVAEIMEGQNKDAKEHRQKLENLEKTIGPMGSWLRCFSCGILSNKPRYKDVEEEKADLEYHSSELWREMYPQGKFHCPPCHKAVHMREGKEIKRRIKSGEMQDPKDKPLAGSSPVVEGLTRVEAEE
jgi:hypothetical protein